MAKKSTTRKTHSSFFITIVLLTSFFTACSGLDNKKHIDVSQINISFDIIRFEQIFFNIDTSNLKSSLEALKSQYPDFYDLYVNDIMEFKNKRDSSSQYIREIKRFLGNEAIQGLYVESQKLYGDFSEIESELTDGFKHLKYYFPERQIPKVITFLSEFAYGNITYENMIAIGLDFYLGKDYKYYPAIGFPQFIIRRLEKQYIARDAMQNIAQDMFPEDNRQKRLIDKMIYRGKIAYLVDFLLPDVEDSIKLNYSSKHLKWLETNETEMWTFFLKHELLFETENREVRKFISEAPNTPGMPSDAPGNVGTWVGWQIVKKFMEIHPEMKLQDLMNENDAQKILTESRYKPLR